MQAYRICKDRLDRVKETLGQYPQGDGPQDGDGRHEPGVDGASPEPDIVAGAGRRWGDLPF